MYLWLKGLKLREENPMNWKTFLLKFVRNVLVGTILSGLFLGVFGYLLAGQGGFINMMIWGLALGLIGSFSSGLALLLHASYWGDYAGRYGSGWLKKESEGEQRDSNH